jgi:hypothetical protein
VVEDLLRQAELCLRSGEFDRSLDLLRQATKLEPDNQEVAVLHSKLKERRALVDQLQALETDYALKTETGSLVAAREVLGQSLRILQDHLSGENRLALDRVLEVGEQVQSDNQRKLVEDSLSTLFEISSADYLTFRAYTLASRWLELGQDIALRGIISSSIEIGDLTGAYRAAQSYMMRYPADPEARRSAVQVRLLIRRRLEESATKRLELATRAVEQEEYETAIWSLDELDAMVRNLRDELPGIFIGDPVLEKIVDEGNKLRTEANALQNTWNKALLILEQAEDMFLNNKLAEAELRLLAIPHAPSAKLSRRIHESRQLIRNQRVDEARHQFLTEIVGIQTRLDGSNRYDLQKTLADLQTLSQKVDWSLLHDDDHTQFRNTLRRVREMLQIREVSEYAHEAIANRDYEKAKAILLSIPAENDPARQFLMQQVDLGLEQQRLERLQQLLRTLFDKAARDFRHRRFLTAQRTVQELGGVLEDLPEESRMLWRVQIETLGDEIKAGSEVWSLFAQAQVQVWEGQKDGQTGNIKEANDLLERVVGYSISNQVVEAIQQQARDLLDSILLGTYMLAGNLDEVERRLIVKMMVEPTNKDIRLNWTQVRATKHLDDLTRQIKMESRLWFWATMLASTVAFLVFVVAVAFALRENTVFASLTLLVTVLTGFLAKAFSDQYQQANQRADRKLEVNLDTILGTVAVEIGDPDMQLAEDSGSPTGPDTKRSKGD